MHLKVNSVTFCVIFLSEFEYLACVCLSELQKGTVTSVTKNFASGVFPTSCT